MTRSLTGWMAVALSFSMSWGRTKKTPKKTEPEKTKPAVTTKTVVKSPKGTAVIGTTKKTPVTRTDPVELPRMILDSVREVKEINPLTKLPKAEYWLIMTTDGEKHHGKYVHYHNNGNKFCEGEFDTGLRCGSWTYWYSNGSKEKEGNFNAGAENGTWTYYYEAGTKQSKGDFRGGKRHGLWTEWHSGEKRSAEGSYNDNDRVGRWTEWHENGTRKTEGEYKKGLRHGPWLEFHPNGKKKTEGAYENGQKSGTWAEYDEQENEVGRETFQSNIREDGPGGAGAPYAPPPGMPLP